MDSTIAKFSTEIGELEKYLAGDASPAEETPKKVRNATIFATVNEFFTTWYLGEPEANISHSSRWACRMGRGWEANLPGKFYHYFSEFSLCNIFQFREIAETSRIERSRKRKLFLDELTRNEEQFKRMYAEVRIVCVIFNVKNEKNTGLFILFSAQASGRESGRRTIESNSCEGRSINAANCWSD